MNWKDIILAVLVAIAWGGFFTSNKVSLDTIPPSMFGFFRFFSVFILTLPFFFKSFKYLFSITLMSVVYFMDSIFVFEATSDSNSLIPIVIANQLVAPFTILIGAILFKEQISQRTLLGLFLVILGSVLVISYREIEDVSNYAISLCVIAALMFALYNILARKLSQMEPLTLLSQVSFAVALIFLITAYIRGEYSSINNISKESIYALCYSIFIVSIFGNGVWFYLLKKYTLKEVAPYTMLIPVSGTVMSVLQFDETITISMISGILLVVLGLMFLQKNTTNSLEH